jgi:hypothetical protein
MKRLAFHVCLLSLPVIAMAAVNYIADPAHIFHPSQRGIEEDVAKLLTGGHNVADARDYDDRLVQRLCIERFTRPNDVVIFGSSRSMEVHSEDFPQQTFFNHSVGAGMIEDFIALYSIYERQHIEPQTIVLNLDPWALNHNNGVQRWTSLSADYSFMARQLGLSVSLDARLARWWAKWVQLVSPAYFQGALRAFARQANGPGPHATRSIVSTKPLLLADGSRRNPQQVVDRSVSEVRRDAASFAATKPLLALGGFRALDEEAKDALERFVELLRLREKRVIIMLVPYHPLPYAVIVRSPEYRAVPQAEQFLLDLARRKNAIGIGSYDPAISGCSDDEFFDAVHPKHSCIERILGEATITPAHIAGSAMLTRPGLASVSGRYGTH